MSQSKTIERKRRATVTSNAAPTYRRERMGGREYIVVPLSMIVPGVLNGSKGPLYYPPGEVSKNVSAWNGIPITLDHPTMNGMPVSGRDPRILDKFGMGFVFQANYQDKLVAEGWFDVENTRRVSPYVYDSLLRRQPLELSTGLFTRNELKSGMFAGREYVEIARNYRPDHLAVFDDHKRGACSLQDGCGVLVNYNPGWRKQPRDPKTGRWGSGGGGGKGKAKASKPAKSKAKNPPTGTIQAGGGHSAQSGGHRKGTNDTKRAQAVQSGKKRSLGDLFRDVGGTVGQLKSTASPLLRFNQELFLKAVHEFADEVQLNYSASQPRDAHGRWSAGKSIARPTVARVSPTPQK